MSSIEIETGLANGTCTPKGQDIKSGKFLPGHSYAKGRPKGSRNKLTQAFIDRVSERTEVGLSMEEILMDMAQDPECTPELRYKAASKILDLTLPKAASVEVLMDDKNKLTKNQIDERITSLLKASFAKKLVSEDEGESE